jgi:hypothetical protein
MAEGRSDQFTFARVRMIQTQTKKGNGNEKELLEYEKAGIIPMS